MNPNELRSRFLSFFERAEHRVVASSPVVPEGDPTLLFTNAGMNQFKDVLLGLEKRDYTRATSVQKCIRAGGKHNDLDEVGKDGRHLTFFEMLGNWSFGDYYKKESIEWAWKFVTTELDLAADRLFVSVYKDDDESYDFWHKTVGLPHSKIVRLGDLAKGDEENFWSMGPTGPCGPCTEIYYDHHPELGPEPWEPGFDEERFVEIWNLVFMEFNRDETGTLTPLPMKSVDTGMGLDRVAAIMSGVDNVFHTGLFSGILAHTHQLLTGDAVDATTLYDRDDFISYCVIADHVRSVAFCISEGAKFSNEGRGYVLRRILRRAVRHGRNLGFSGPFLHRVAEALVQDFGEIYPELRLKQKEAAAVIKREEERFFSTIERGIEIFETIAGAAVDAGERELKGTDVFKLYDTYGFPPDLTEIMAEEKSLKIDWAGYEAAMQAQRSRSKAADDRYADNREWHILQDGAANTFVGYDNLTADADVLRYRLNEAGDELELCLSQTPFYAESGGQVGDMGVIVTHDGSLRLRVSTTKNTTAGITHFASIESGTLDPALFRKPVTATVDAQARRLTTCNHTATHLLHAALHEVVSEEAYQAGSLVSPRRLRFDFNHDRPLTDDELRDIETWVNERVQGNAPVKVHLNVSLAEAESMGAMMIFGEKYGDNVRVIEVPGHSIELCGGCHVNELNDIGRFRIVSETGVAAGVRRIEAVTNQGVFELAEADRELLARVADHLKSSRGNIEDKLTKLIAENVELKQRVDELTRAQAAATSTSLLDTAELLGDVKVVAAQVDAADRNGLLELADKLRDQLGERAIVMLAAAIDDRPALLVAVTDAVFKAHKLKAGDLVNVAAAEVGGRGGGRPTLAQAGGKDATALPQAVAAFKAHIAAKLG